VYPVIVKMCKPRIGFYWCNLTADFSPFLLAVRLRRRCVCGRTDTD